MSTKIGIIVGSIRAKSQSKRVSKIIADLLQQKEEVTVEIFCLKSLNIPLWSEDKWDKDSIMSANWLPISKNLKSCDGFVVITPEWAGMVPPHLKNFLLMCDKGELAYKSSLIVSISSGMGGAYPIAELRMSGYKNNYIWWLPEHLLYRNVESLFTKEVDEVSDSLITRTKHSLNLLLESVKALKPVKEKCQNLSKFPYGM